jgi:hypothetical protein
VSSPNDNISPHARANYDNHVARRRQLSSGPLAGIHPIDISEKNMSAVKSFSSVIVISLLLTSCKDNTVQVDDKQPGLYMKVTDTNGISLPGVGFHYIFYGVQNTISRNMLITYTLSKPDTITLKLFSPLRQEIATLYYKTYQLSGNYSYNYDASALTNGVYFYRLTTPSSTIEGKLFVITDDIAQLQTLPPLTTTDQEGNAQITGSALGIGDHFNYQIGSTQYQFIISDSITVLLVKEGHKNYLQTIRIDTTKASTFTFQMINN